MTKPVDGGDTFLGRWSQRKVQARTGAVPVDVPVKPAAVGSPTTLATVAAPAAKLAESPAPQALAATGAATTPETPADPNPSRLPSPPPPTLDDVAQLTAESDYSAFAARTVDPNVRNAAMRKLFAGNPHFNVMDGLDVYIDDYSVGEPIPKSMLRQMVQARSLGLLDDDLVDQDKPPSADLPNRLAANDTAPQHENTDLQLQRDDAAGHSRFGERAEPGEEHTADLAPELPPERGAEPHPDPLGNRPG